MTVRTVKKSIFGGHLYTWHKSVCQANIVYRTSPYIRCKFVSTAHPFATKPLSTEGHILAGIEQKTALKHGILIVKIQKNPPQQGGPHRGVRGLYSIEAQPAGWIETISFGGKQKWQGLLWELVNLHSATESNFQHGKTIVNSQQATVDNRDKISKEHRDSPENVTIQCCQKKPKPCDN